MTGDADALVSRRNALVRQMFDHAPPGLDPAEQCELDAIRASLDAIESVSVWLVPAFERLEALAADNELLAQAVANGIRTIADTLTVDPETDAALDRMATAIAPGRLLAREHKSTDPGDPR